jgi:anhydro-N-acetylmuramic acid kinase
VAESLRSAPAWPDRCFVGGGGTRNASLRAALVTALADAAPPGAVPPSLEPVEAAGIPSTAKEAIAFALLGYETLHGRPGSLPGATGARHPSVLGAIWPAENTSRLLGSPRAGSPRKSIRRVQIRASATPTEGVERPWNREQTVLR